MPPALPEGCQPGNWLARICALETRVSTLEAIIEGDIVAEGTSYWGRSELEALTGAQVAGLAGSGTSGISAGVYSIAAGPGYWYFVVPESIPAPMTIKITSSGLPLPLAVAPGQAAYTGSINGLSYAPVSVEGVPYRMFRGFNTMAGAGSLTVT